jgi:hypothetical protein
MRRNIGGLQHQSETIVHFESLLELDQRSAGL